MTRGVGERRVRPGEVPFLDFVDLLEEFSLNVPTLREVPRKAQSQLAALTQGVCEAVEEAGRCPTCLRSSCVMTTRRDTDVHRSVSRVYE